jgi:hypothetical protein
MMVSRERFLDQFGITFAVHCLRHWPKRRKGAPTFLTACFYEWIKTNGGRMTIGPADFARLAEPVIEEVHRTKPDAERPDWKVVAGKLYDVLDEACVEVTLKPFEMVTAARSSQPPRRRDVPPKER